MFHYILVALLVFSVSVFAPQQALAKKVAVDDIAVSLKDTIQKIQEKLPYKDPKLQDLRTTESFTEKELAAAIDVVLKPEYMYTLSDEQVQQLKSFKKAVVKSLENYKVSGFSFCVNGNKALIKDTQDPQFTVVFKDGQGNMRTKNFQAKFVGYGLKFQLAFKFDFIFFLGTDLNLFNTQDPIELGSGFEFGWNFAVPTFLLGARRLANLALLSGIEFTYISFKNHAGGMLIAAPSFFYNGAISLSYITSGGTLTPLD